MSETVKTSLALAPGVICFFYAYYRGAEKAFLDIYLPSLLLLPDYLRWVCPGLPDPSFNQAAILPVIFFYFWRGGRWHVTLLDIFVFGFAYCCGYSEYLNEDWSEAQNLIFQMFTTIVAPYMMAKAIIEQNNLRHVFAKRLIFLFGLVVLSELYEFRMKMNLFRRWFRAFFPWQGYRWVTTIRWGFGRAAGPYAHAILCGVMMSVGFQIQRWLQDRKVWKRPWWQVSFITLWILGGVLITISRGPWVGLACGVFIYWLGNVRNRLRTIGIVLFACVLVGIPAYIGFRAYVAVGRSGAATGTQETAAYRKELIDRYLHIGLRRPYWGWGLNGWPKVPGMPSIDNYWLLLFLQHGGYALSCFVLLFFFMSLRLWLMGIALPWRTEISALCFALIACLAVYFVSITTVFLGFQTRQFLFILAGWGEAIILKGRAVMEVERPHKFKKVLS